MNRFHFYSNVKRIIVITGTVLLLYVATARQGSWTVQPVEHSGSTDHPDRSVLTPFLLHHPFENACKFPIVNPYASDISEWRYSERLRTLKCPVDQPLATMDSDGAMYVHSHFAKYPEIEERNRCWVLIMDGGLRAAKHKFWGKNDPTVVATIEPPLLRRFLVNADTYLIRCNETDNNTVVWEKAFAGFYDPSQPTDQLIILDETPKYDKFGRKRKIKKAVHSDRLSIDILALESTSRTMFQRQMPRTWETMQRLGFEIFYGYNKMTDNSLVNIAPIMLGDIKEALENPKLDASGDINLQWVIPTNRTLDPTDLPFLFKFMKEKYGCKTMFNDDISRRDLGLFHYHEWSFFNGFYRKPADHFYKAFYCLIYNKWKYGPCKDGGQIQKEYVDLWYRFAKRYRDVCHFGFSFITTLLDEHLNQRLESLDDDGLLDNSLQVIMGDHGNRIGGIKTTYTGRIEERMPLLAIRVPKKIRESHSEAYRQFQENRFKLISNFDIHQTLVDVVEMKFGEEREDAGGRGTSLFREIPANRLRSCFDAYIPENFCTCLIDRSTINETFPDKMLPSVAEISKRSLRSIKQWILDSGLGSCIEKDSLPTNANFTILGVNPLVRYGLMNKGNATQVQDARKGRPSMNFLWHEATFPVRLRRMSVNLRFRVEFDVIEDKCTVNFEPQVLDVINDCPYKTVTDVCDCIGSL